MRVIRNIPTEPMPASVTSMCYVLEAFPRPSETFVSEEILSVMDHGIATYVFALSRGSSAVIHSSAQAVLSRSDVWYRCAYQRFTAVAAILQIALRRPYSTLRALAHAVRSPRRWIYFQAAPEALKLIKARVQWLHAHFADENLVWTHAVSIWSGIPFGVTTHRYDIVEDPLPADVATELFDACSLVVTISEFNKRLIHKKYGLTEDRIHVVHCGIDLRQFPFFGRPPIQGRKLRLINVARLVPVKNHVTLLQSFARAITTGLDAHLDLVGDGDLRPALETLTVELGIAELVTFHGTLSQEAVSRLLRESDAFVLSSLVEGIPVACMEAMASGAIAIAPNITGIPELVENGKSGLLVKPNDVNSLAEAIVSLFSGTFDLETMRTRARGTIERDFDRSSCTDELLDAVERALNKTRACGPQ